MQKDRRTKSLKKAAELSSALKEAARQTLSPRVICWIMKALAVTEGLIIGGGISGCASEGSTQNPNQQIKITIETSPEPTKETIITAASNEEMRIWAEAYTWQRIEEQDLSQLKIPSGKMLVLLSSTELALEGSNVFFAFVEAGSIPSVLTTISATAVVGSGLAIISGVGLSYSAWQLLENASSNVLLGPQDK